MQMQGFVPAGAKIHTSMPPSSILRKIRSLTKVDPGIVKRDRVPGGYCSEEGELILEAVREFSIDKPFVQVTTLAATTNVSASFSYPLVSVDPLWSPEYNVLRVEYPLDNYGLGRRDWHASVDPNDWEVTQDPRTQAYILKFVGGTQPSQDFAVWYSGPHLFDPVANTTSMTLQDEDALVQLAACNILQQAFNEAARWADENGQQINVGGVKKGIQDAIDMCQTKYDKFKNKRPRTIGPVFAEWFTEDMFGERLFHPPERP